MIDVTAHRVAIHRLQGQIGSSLTPIQQELVEDLVKQMEAYESDLLANIKEEYSSKDLMSAHDLWQAVRLLKNIMRRSNDLNS